MSPPDGSGTPAAHEGPVESAAAAKRTASSSSSLPAPYGDAAQTYYAAGWRGVVPVEGKSRPLSGYTGAQGQDTSYPDVFTWTGDPATARLNIALRLPADVIGIDVDAYDGRNGARTRDAFEQRWGALPPTYSTTSRTDGASGIRLYRVEGAADLAWPANLDELAGGPSHVDIIRRAHRYAMVWPSVHPDTGAVYRWTGPDGEHLDKPPAPGDLPVLPHAWVAGITGGQTSSPTSGLADPMTETEQRKHSGPIAEGDRHRALVAYAGWLRAFGLPLGEASTLMLRRLEDCAQPPQARYPVTRAEALDKLRDVYGRYAAGAEVPEEPPTEGRASSWDPVDLTSVLDGSYAPLQPSIMARSDGQCLLYRGRVHSLHGESESGKSLVAQTVAAGLLRNGERVIYVDYESSPDVVVGRLLLMGVEREAVRTLLDYVRPEGSPLGQAAWGRLLGRPASLAVLDGVTEALVGMGRATIDNDEVTAWFRQVPRTIAERTGAAVALVDHVTKSTEGRGRFAIGAQAKLSALDGAAYAVEVVEPLGRGLRGSVRLWVGKDREGGVRPHCGHFRASDRTQHAATVVVDSTSGQIVTEILPPEEIVGSERKPFRPTGLMEKISRALEAKPVPVTGNAITKGSDFVAGKTTAKTAALRILVEEGYLTTETGGNRSVLHSVARPYREASEAREPLTALGLAPRGPDPVVALPPIGRGNREPPGRRF
jgi:hypothetical protein